MTDRVTIIGDGQMGLVLAGGLAQRGVEVRLWGPFENDLVDLARTRRSRRLPEFELPHAVAVEPDAAAALEGASVVIDAIPTQYIRKVWERFAEVVPLHADILSVSKGIEERTLLTPLQIIDDVLGSAKSAGARRRPLVCVSGPTIATELARRLPATMVAASTDAAASERAQHLLNCAWLRIYTLDDVAGVEIAGAVKNVIALAAGMVDGMELGINAKSALLARGLAEIVRLGLAVGAQRETFFGIAGVGDLATTCFSPYGRNRTCGERLGRGERLEDILADTPSVVEGVPTTKSVVQLAARRQIEMPITEAVHAILFEGLKPADAIASLMERELKAERVG